MSARVFLVIGWLCFLAACTRTVAPAPFELHTHEGPPAQSEATGPHPDRIAVGNGDTLYGISRKYGVPMRAIIDANRLAPPYRLAAGISIVLPQVRTHLVRSGDTLAGVARQYGVDMSTLAAANRLDRPYVIRVGETLILPSPVESERSVQTAEALPASPPQPFTSAPLAPPPPVTGTLLSPVPQAEPAAMPLPKSVTPSPPPAAAPLPVAAAQPMPPPLAAAPPAPPPPEAPPPPPEPKVAAAPPPAEQLASLPPTFPVAGKGFVWPVRGRVVSTYGTGSDGIHNDGVNIAAAEGTPIVAADAGEVAYAGNELKGYGNLILIKHPTGFVTAYAHASVLLVKRGDKVSRGQPIAKVGATGAVSEPQLHFEIRRGARTLDPVEYLPSAAATAKS